MLQSSLTGTRQRNNITIIPQDPYLFDDTLKKNLDPNGWFKDSDIITILQAFDIWEKFQEQGGMQFRVESGAFNLSQGEKQLLCMARAILNKNKLILLDEATANIDIKTEQKIQKAIKENFKGSTILMIAHRLNTILFCDKILVLDKGNVIEYGAIEKLKNDPSSSFGAMLKKSQDVMDMLG